MVKVVPILHSLREYGRSVLRHWVSLCFGFFFALIGIAQSLVTADAIPGIPGRVIIPAIFWYLAALVALFVAQFMAFHALRLQYDALKHHGSEGLRQRVDQVGELIQCISGVLDKMQRAHHKVAGYNTPFFWIEGLRKDIPFPTAVARDAQLMDFVERAYVPGVTSSPEELWRRCRVREDVSLPEFKQFHRCRRDLIHKCEEWATSLQPASLASLIAELARTPSTATMLVQLAYLEIALAKALGNPDPFARPDPPAWVDFLREIHNVSRRHHPS